MGEFCGQGTNWEFLSHRQGWLLQRREQIWSFNQVSDSESNDKHRNPTSERWEVHESTDGFILVDIPPLTRSLHTTLLFQTSISPHCGVEWLFVSLEKAFERSRRLVWRKATMNLLFSLAAQSLSPAVFVGYLFLLKEKEREDGRLARSLWKELRKRLHEPNLLMILLVYAMTLSVAYSRGLDLAGK